MLRTSRRSSGEHQEDQGEEQQEGTHAELEELSELFEQREGQHEEQGEEQPEAAQDVVAVSSDEGTLAQATKHRRSSMD